MKCLTLLGSTGVEPEWNDISKSTGHRTIPLPNWEFIENFPMFSNLIRQLGFNIEKFISEQRNAFHVFYVPDALGSPLIPAQNDFVIPYSVKSVLGFGGLMPSGDFFSLILFSKDFIPKKSAELFGPLALSTKISILPFDDKTTGGHEKHFEELSTLTQLLEVNEQCVLEQYEQLDHSLTQLRETQQSLLQTSKLAALGEMAGGIAHEINNPLAAIQVLAGQLQDTIESDSMISKDEMLQTIKIIENQVSRIANIIRGLRNFSRDGSGDLFLPAKLKDIIDDTLVFCSKRFSRANVKLETFIGHHDLEIECRATEISQVLVNLLNNAFDAIRELPEKWVTLAIEDKGELVIISVTDSGNGIPPQIANRIFDPFFTTKELDKGTGLGLSISKGLIEMHHGRLSIDTACANTRFIVSLPKKQA